VPLHADGVPADDADALVPAHDPSAWGGA
jgi:hypothetical protein